jgi:hypothetical protein
MRQPRPRFELLLDNPQPHTGLAQDFQSLASESYEGFDALDASAGQSNAGMSVAIGPGESGLLAMANDISSGLVALGNLGDVLAGLDPSPNLSGALSAEQGFAIDLSAAEVSAAGPAINAFTLSGIPALPPSSGSLPPLPITSTSVSNTNSGSTGSDVLWQITLGAKILSIPLTPSAAAWVPGTTGIAGLPGVSTIASFLPIISAVALGALLPFEILKVFFGIDPFSSAASDAEIAIIKATAQKVVDNQITTLREVGAGARNAAGVVQTASLSYSLALDYLQSTTCYILSYTDPRESSWQAQAMTNLVQAWVQTIGTFPPAVTCKGQG